MFDTVTTELSAEKSVTISKISVIVHLIKEKLDNFTIDKTQSPKRAILFNDSFASDPSLIASEE